MVAATSPAEILFLHGRVITMEGQGEGTQALAVKDGRILAVGRDAEVLGRKGPRTTVVELHGQTLLPGFIDAHSHISAVAAVADLAELSPPPVGGVTDVASLQA